MDEVLKRERDKMQAFLGEERASSARRINALKGEVDAARRQLELERRRSEKVRTGTLITISQRMCTAYRLGFRTGRKNGRRFPGHAPEPTTTCALRVSCHFSVSKYGCIAIACRILVSGRSACWYGECAMFVLLKLGGTWAKKVIVRPTSSLKRVSSSPLSTPLIHAESRSRPRQPVNKLS